MPNINEDDGFIDLDEQVNFDDDYTLDDPRSVYTFHGGEEFGV